MKASDIAKKAMRRNQQNETNYLAGGIAGLVPVLQAARQEAAEKRQELVEAQISGDQAAINAAQTAFNEADKKLKGYESAWRKAQSNALFRQPDTFSFLE